MLKPAHSTSPIKKLPDPIIQMPIPIAVEEVKLEKWGLFIAAIWIAISDKNKVELKVHEGDDPETLTNAFLEMHKLPKAHFDVIKAEV